MTNFISETGDTDNETTF